MKHVKKFFALFLVLFLVSCDFGTQKPAEGSGDKPIDLVTKEKYSVTLSKNIDEGGLFVGEGSYEENSKVKVKATPNSHYSFIGWYNGNEKVSELNEYEFTITKNITLEAKFELVKQNVTISKNIEEAGIVTGAGVYSYNQTVEVIAVANTGYSFLGWYKQNTNLSTNSTYSFKMGEENVELEAKFEKTKCELTIGTLSNLGGAVTGNGTYDYGTEVTVKANIEDYYKFEGWYIGKELKETALEYKFTITEDTHVLAKWTVINYSITYHLNGGINSDSNINNYDVETIFTFADAEKQNYEFKGWYTDAEFKNKLEELNNNHGNLDLYAKFVLVTKNITLDKTSGGEVAGAGSYEFGKEVTIKATASDYYQFEGWYEGNNQISILATYTFDMPANDLTYIAKFSPITYTITYHLDGGTNYEQNPNEYTVETEYSFVAAKKEEYQFEGWYTDAEFKNKLEELNKNHGNLDLYAKFVPVTKKVTANATTGGTVIGAGTYDYDSEVTLKASALDYYQFEGWFINDKLVETEDEYKFTLKEDTYILAKFSPINYSIIYILNGGINDEDNINTYNVETQFAFNDAKKEGFTFLGWYLDAEFKDQIEELNENHGDLNLYARFVVETEKVTVNVSKGGSITGTGLYEYGDQVVLTAKPDKYFKFEGWYIEDKLVESETEYKFIIKENVSLQALFSPIKYYVTTINSDENAGSISTLTNYECTNNDEIYLSASPVTAYKFEGWYEGEVLVSNDPKYEFNPTKDITLTAKWGLVEYNINVTVDKFAEYVTVTYPEVAHLGDKLTLKIKINNEDYSLDGWFVNGTIAIGYTETLEYTFNEYSIARVDENNTLNITVKVYKSRYTLTLTNSNENAGTITKGETGKYKYNTQITLIMNHVSPDYKFLGWYDSEGLVSELKTYSFTMPLNDLAYEAKWEAVDYRITYHLDGGTNDEANINTYTVETKFTFNDATKTGYKFLGWYLDDAFKTQIEVLDNNHDNIDLYAKFEVEKKTVIINNYSSLGGTVTGAGTYDYGTEVTVKAELEDYYVFDGWYEGLTQFSNLITKDAEYKFTITEDTYISAKWSMPIYYISTYNSDLGAGTITKLNGYDCLASKEIALSATPTKGYKFVGWYDGETLVSNDPNYKFRPTKNITLTANWNLFDYNVIVTIDKFEEHVTVEAPKTAQMGSKIALKVIIDSEDYAVDGWFVNGNIVIGYGPEFEYNFDSYSVNTLVDENNNLNIIVKIYKVYNTLTLTNSNPNAGYITQGGSGSYRYQSSIRINLNVKTGYKFEGWYDENDKFVSGKNPYSFYMPNHDLSLTAKWSLIEYSITYHLDGGINDEANVEKHTVESEIRLKAPKKAGYSFLGWYLDESFIYSVDIIINSHQDTDLYAKYELETYTITYNLDGGTNNTNNVTTYTVESPVTFYEPTKSLHDFKYWYILDGENEVVVTDTKGLTGNLEVYAKFDEVEGLKAFNYTVSGNDIIINSVKDDYVDATELVISDKVVEIKEGALNKCSKLVKLTIPFIGNKRNTVLDDNQYPFGYIFGETENSSSRGLNQKYIKTYSSSNPTYETTTYYIPATLREVIITDATAVTCSAFEKCYWLTDIKLNGAVDVIADRAFYRCEGLTEIIIPEGLLKIGKDAFNCCEDLVKVVVPNSCMYIGESAFANCYALASLTLPFIGERRYNSTDAYQYPLGYLFKDNTSGDYIVNQTYNYLSSTTETMSVRMYNNLKEIIITDCTYLQKGALENLKSLTKVVLPSGMTSLAEGVLAGCSSLESLTIPFVGTKITNTDSYEGYVYDYLFGCIFGQNEFEGAVATKQSRYDYETYENDGYHRTYYIPSSLTEVIINSTNELIIPCSAFMNCSNIVSIVLPNQVTQISYQAFYNCTNLETINIPSSLTSMGAYAFLECHSLKEIIIYNGITSIEQQTFKNCYSLEKLIIPETVKYLNCYYYINNTPFCNCESLKEIVIPAGVESIEKGLLRGCSSIEKLTMPFIGSSKNSTSATLGYIFGDFEFANTTKTLDYYIPNSLKEVVLTNCDNIPENAFYNCKNLTDIVMPSTVTAIGNEAFVNCDNLANLVIANVTSLGDTPFGNSYSISGNVYYTCSKEEWVDNHEYLPISAKRYYLDANGDVEYKGIKYSSLTDVVIPDTMNSFAKNHFEYCNDLKNVYYDGTIEDWCNCTFANDYSNPMCKASNFYILDSNGNVDYNGKTYRLLAEVVIPNSITAIKNYTFQKFACLTSVVMANNVETIGISAFEQCNITNINLSANLTTIDKCAFKNCTKIQRLYLPNSLSIINEEAFMYCTCEIVWGDNPSITKIKGGAFKGYRGQKLIIPNSVETIGQSAFDSCSRLTEIDIPSSVTEIGSYAFSRCTNLKNIVIPSGVTKLGRSTFRACTGLETITIPSSVTEIGIVNFEQCTCKIIWDGDSKITEIKEDMYGYYWGDEIYIPNGVTTIGNYAFRNCKNVKSIVIPNSVTSIGTDAMVGCFALESLTVPFIGEKEYTSSDTDQKTLRYFFVNIPSTLRTVTITKSYVSKFAFSELGSVETIILDEGVETIGASAFSKSKNLKTVVLPSTLRYSNSSAFYSIPTLENVYYNGTMADWCKISFNNSETSHPLENENVQLFFKDENGSIEYNGNNYSIYPSEMVVPDGVATITRLFFRFTQMISVVIPADVTKIYSYSFSYCENLKAVYYKGTIEDWCNIEFENARANPLSYGAKLYILDENGEVLHNGLKYKEINNLVIPEAKTEVKEFAFYGLDIDSITIPNTITKINTYGFVNSTVKDIEFYPRLKTFAMNAFKDCEKIDNIYFNGSFEDYLAISFNTDSNPLLYAKNLYVLDENGVVEYNGKKYSLVEKNYIIPSGTIEIKTHQFDGYAYLESITIPNTVKSIGTYAFSRCTCKIIWEDNSTITTLATRSFQYYAGAELVIPVSIEEISSSSFVSCENLTTVYYCGNETGWNSIGIGSGNSYITSAAIYYYSETEPTEPGNYWHYVNGVATKW